MASGASAGRAARACWLLFGAALAAALAFGLSALFDVARALTVDYLDSFEYLVNGRILAEGADAVAIEYRWRRPPLVSLVQALAYPAGGGIDAALAAFRNAHVLAWAFSAAALGAVYWLLRASFDRTTSLLGAVLVAANPMFLHLVPFGLVDIPAMLTTTLAIGTWGIARRSRSRAATVAAGIAIAAAMATKYNLLLLPVALLLFEAWNAFAERAKEQVHRESVLRAMLAPRIVASGVIAGGAWLLLQSGLRMHVEGAGWDAPLRVFATFLAEFDYVGLHTAPDNEEAFPGWDDPRSEYVEEIFQTTSWATLAALAAGGYRAARHGTPADRLHLVWVTLFGLVMSFGILTKASRYLLPVLPSIVHLELRGLVWAHGAFTRWLEARSLSLPARRAFVIAAGAAGLALVLWLPARQAHDQLRHFEDPIYRMSFIEEIVRTLENETAKDAPILWRGNIYSIYPAEPVFFPHDEAFYFYHVARPTLEFFLNRPVSPWPFGRPYHREDLVETFPSDGAVVTHDSRFHLTHLAHRLPDVPAPLRTDIITRRTFAATGRSPRVLKDRDDPDRQVRLRRVEGGYQLPHDLLAFGWHVFRRATPGAPPESFTRPVAEPPFAVELLRVHRSEFRFRE